MTECNFNAFMKVLNVFVGRKDRQASLLRKQVETTLSDLSTKRLHTGDFTRSIKSSFMKLNAIHCHSETPNIKRRLQDAFWKAFDGMNQLYMEEFKDQWPHGNISSTLAIIMNEICMYYDLVHEMHLEDEKENILARGKEVVYDYFQVVLDKIELEESGLKWIPVTDGTHKNRLSPQAWVMMLESILLLSYSNHFCNLFGTLKIELNRRLVTANEVAKERLPYILSYLKCRQCKKYMPSDPEYKESRHCKSCQKIYTTAVPQACFKCNTNLAYEYNRYTSSSSDNKCCTCSVSYYLLETKIAVDSAFLGQVLSKENAITSLQPSHPDIYHDIIQIKVPNLLSDPNHYGYLPFKYCQLLDRHHKKRA
jgi:hypothetical protein